MNDKNLKSLRDRPNQERKEIARKGGRASALKKKEGKVKAERYKNLIEILDNSFLAPGQKLKGILGNASHLPESYQISAYDYYLSQVFELLLCQDRELQGDRIKAAKFLYQIKEDQKRDQERKEEREVRKALALKELQIKERELDLEERRIRIKEELIRMENKKALDLADVGITKQNPELLGNCCKKENEVNEILVNDYDTV